MATLTVTKSFRLKLTTKPMNTAINLLNTGDEEKKQIEVMERAKELDGCFFEKFTTLNKAIERNRSQKEIEMRNAQEMFIPEERDVQMRELTEEQRQALYSEVVYTVVHQLGAEASKTSSLTQGELFVYAQQALGIDQEQHRKLYTKTRERKAPTCVLRVRVSEAKDLQAKDANGLSDPYCMIGLMPSSDCWEEDRRSSRSRKKSKTLKEISGEIKSFLTSVQKKTLNPKWNETFTLDVQDANRESFHLDIWDWDDSSSVLDEDNKITSIKGLAGMGRFFKQIIQSSKKSEDVDDFLGFLEIPIKDIPSKGFDEWYCLQGRSSQSNVSGQCHVQLKLSAPKRETDSIPKDVSVHFKTHVDIHTTLLEQFVHHRFVETQESENGNVIWNGQLSPAAEWILHQHAVQNELMDLQKAVIHWRVFSRYHQIQPLEYDFLQSLLHLIKSLWPTNKLSDVEIQLLLQSLQLFMNFTQELIRKHRDVFPGTRQLQLSKLKEILECLKIIFEFEVFKDTQSNPVSSYVEDLIKLGTLEWFRKVYVYTQPQQKKEKDLLKSMVELADIVALDMIKARKFYQNIFEGIGCDYFGVIYRQLETLLCSHVQDIMIQVNLKIKEDQELIGKTLFKLYLTLKDVVSYQADLKTPVRVEETLALSDFHEWFKSAVTGWFNIARDKSKDRITKAVELDQIVRIDSYVNHSTSAVDATGCLDQICQFWQQLQWPDTAASYVFVTQITDDVCDSAAFYTESLYQKLVQNGFYDEDRTQFDVTDQTCVTLNNMQYIELWLKELPKRVEWDQVMSSMVEVHGQQARRHCQQTLNTRLTSARDDIDKMIDRLVIHIGKKMSVDIKKLLKAIAWSQESASVDTAVEPLLEYLDSNLITLHNNLIPPVFNRILAQIWVTVLENFLYILKSQLSNPAKFYQRLDEALKILEEFFHADGVGVSLDQIQTPLNQTVQGMLGLYTSSSEDLIEQFFEEKMDEQFNTTEEELGSLTFRVLYSSFNNTLLVEVLNARNLKPLDTNGLSDPYVTLELLPRHCFPDVEPVSTEVVKKTLFPLFDETFEFPVPSTVCKKPGACLMFTVMDHDVLFDNDVAGHVLVPLNNVAGLDDSVPGGLSNVPQQTIPIIHLQPSGKYFKVLECRDEEICRNFVQDLKQNYEKASADHEKALITERKNSRAADYQ